MALSPVGLNSQQLAMAALIEREFTAAGFSPLVAAAAVVNAYAESRLDPKAVGDSGRSIGLFQLSIKGAGAGMSVAARQDPTTNTRTLIAREARALAKIKAAVAKGASLGDLVEMFSTYVERPGDKPGEAVKRRLYAVRLFPFGVTAPVQAPPIRAATSIATVRTSTLAKPSKGWLALISASGLLTAALLYRALAGPTRRLQPLSPAR